jgi:V/A-type H+/Na+-transporting ATPase subunit E
VRVQVTPQKSCNELPQISTTMPECDLERAEERIQTICEKIRSEVIEPAQQEAARILTKAQEQAASIVEKARLEASQTIEMMKSRLEEEKRIFDTSVQQGAKQAVDLLKQKIETSLFNPALEQWIIAELDGAKEHGKLLQACIEALDKEGINADLSIKIPKTFTPEEITAEVSKNIAERLKKSDIEVVDMKSGIIISLKGKYLTIDISKETLQELLAMFIRKDFRKNFFTQ